jgi:hypothetical protein
MPPMNRAVDCPPRDSQSTGDLVAFFVFGFGPLNKALNGRERGLVFMLLEAMRLRDQAWFGLLFGVRLVLGAGGSDLLHADKYRTRKLQV